jgi:pSer/pThr/pTyr-binding forkhead associated (FHA) protein
MAFKLIIRSEGGDPREIDLPEAGVTFGRHASNTEKLEGAEVSRFHARFEVRGEHVLVTDRESYSGTWIDGALLDGSFELGHGDRVDIGSHEIFIVDVAKAFTLPKYTPPREDEDEADDGGDDFFERKPEPGGLRVISSLPPPAKPQSVESRPEETPPVPEEEKHRDATSNGDVADGEKAESAETASTTASSETESSVAPLPAFKMSASSEALATALERAGRSVSREHHRIVFIAPDPPRDPIGMRSAPITFGTDPECTVRVDGEGIRATHATLAVESGVVVVRAAGEGATVRVNGADTERCVLTPGDRVEIGNVTFVAAGRAREHYTAASRTTGWASSVPVFSVPSAGSASNARAWLFAVLILAAGVGGMLFLLLGREQQVHVPPETPRTVPTEALDAGPTRDASARDVPLAMSPAEVETRLAEARGDVEAFETQNALARLSVFHGRTDLPTEVRIRAAMLEVTAYVADNRPEDAARSCANAISIAGGDMTFLADESPRVRTLCGVVGGAYDAGATSRDAGTGPHDAATGPRVGGSDPL